MEQDEQEDNAPVARGPPCRKSPLLAALNVSGTHGQMLVVYSGKGWDWSERKGKGGKGKHRRKEVKKVTFLSDMWRYHLETNQWFPIRYDDGPLGRWKEGATPVYNNSELVLMGGCTETSVKFSRNDLWVFTPVRGGGSWRRVHTSNPPVARRGHVLVANHSHLIMFGGKTTHRREERAVEEMEEGIPDLDYTPQPGEKCLVDLWVISKDEVLKGSSTKEPPRWQEGAPFPAGCRWGGTGSFLRDYLGKKYLAMFGGRHLSAGSVEHQASSKYVYYNDLWLYDFMQDGWYQAPTKGARSTAAVGPKSGRGTLCWPTSGATISTRSRGRSTFRWVQLPPLDSCRECQTSSTMESSTWRFSQVRRCLARQRGQR